MFQLFNPCFSCSFSLQDFVLAKVRAVLSCREYSSEANVFSNEKISTADQVKLGPSLVEASLYSVQLFNKPCYFGTLSLKFSHAQSKQKKVRKGTTHNAKLNLVC